ncbi:MAG: OmpA family protein [Phycisphaeraceae bacterium]
MGLTTRMVACCLGLMMLALVGCQPPYRVLEEREALYIQNQELQDQLNQARTAVEVCERDRSNLLGEIERLKRELAMTPTTVVPANAFAGIAGIETEQSDTQIKVRVPGDVLFASGAIDLKNASKSTLNQIASVIQREYPNQTIRVEGHTDTDPIRKSSWKDNLELSLERSAAVHRHLQTQGIDPKRMYAAGFGEWRPQPTKDRSRRVTIVVVLVE